MIRFLLDVKHDNGMLSITTHATDAAAARRLVIAAEGCPERAIRRVRAVCDEGYELEAENPTKYRTLRLLRGEMRVDEFNRGPNLPDKVPTRYEVFGPFDRRWRRVYSTRHTGARYIILDGLKVMVVLPEDMT